jgi:DNA polymerase-3 subunit beta
MADHPLVDDVYESVMIESAEHGVFIHATDGNVWTRASIPSEGQGLGRVMIKSSQLGQIVRNLGGGDVELELAGSEMLLTSGSYRAKFPVRPAVEYPPAPSPEVGRWTTIDAQALDPLIESVALCAYDKPDRPALCGVNLEVLGSDIWAVAADGARIGCAVVHTGEERFPLTMTLPVPFARHASRMALSGAIDFGINKFGMAVFRTETMTVVGKAVGQPFPNWRAAKNLPKDDDPAAMGEFEVKPLLKALKRVMALTGKSSVPGLRMFLQDGALELHMEQSGKESEEIVSADEHGGPSACRMVNGGKLMQILGSISSPTTRIKIPCNPDHPVGVAPIGEKDDKHVVRFWVMPRAR